MRASYVSLACLVGLIYGFRRLRPLHRAQRSRRIKWPIFNAPLCNFAAATEICTHFCTRVNRKGRGRRARQKRAWFTVSSLRRPSSARAVYSSKVLCDKTGRAMCGAVKTTYVNDTRGAAPRGPVERHRMTGTRFKTPSRSRFLTQWRLAATDEENECTFREFSENSLAGMRHETMLFALLKYYRPFFSPRRRA